MFLKKVLNQPNLVGTVLIALMVCSGLVYAVGFDGFNVETVAGSEVEAWLAAAGDGSSSGSGDGTEDTPPESPTPENPEGEEDEDDEDGEDDPPSESPTPENPEDEDDEDGEDDPPEIDCTCTFTTKGIADLCGCPPSISGKPCKGQTIDGCKRKAGTGCRLTTGCKKIATDGTGERRGCYWSICKNAVNGKHSECDRTSCPKKGQGTHPGKL